jgi:hypothetical protein
MLHRLEFLRQMGAIIGVMFIDYQYFADKKSAGYSRNPSVVT